MSKTTSSAVRVRRHDPAREKLWRRMLKAFARSGQSVRGFCSAHGVSEPSFYAWRRTLAQRDASPAAPPAPAFVPVRLAEAVTAHLEIVLAGGRCIRLHGPVDRQTLAEVVAALESVQ